MFSVSNSWAAKALDMNRSKNDGILVLIFSKVIILGIFSLKVNVQVVVSVGRI